jgi:hypothetical protein
MSDDKEQKRDWVDLAIKALTPIIAGLLIAWAGFVGNRMLSSISSKQESARLITELQIKREQAESVLRKDVFDKALEAFLLKRQDNAGTLQEMSKQLLRLELLALNFGDSLSLSPLFAEVRNDLYRAKPVDGEDLRNYKERKGELRKRLNGLAKRVASTQLSSIAQHGEIIKVYIPLFEYDEGDTCKETLFEDRDFAWPDFKIYKQMGVLDDEFQMVDEYKTEDGRPSDSFNELVQSDFLEGLVREASLIELKGIKRYLRLNITNVDHCKKTAQVQIRLFKDDPEKPEINRSFRLDYFNFPMVDNTRLSDNHRFAIIMDQFELKGSQPHIDITGVVFPSEYASLRDKPGMKEARTLLESALNSGENDD